MTVIGPKACGIRGRLHVWGSRQIKCIPGHEAAPLLVRIWAHYRLVFANDVSLYDWQITVHVD